MSSKTIAWQKLTKMTGKGKQGIDYRHATTNAINNRIAEIFKLKKINGRKMYEKSLRLFKQQIRESDYAAKLKDKNNKSIIVDRKCAICHENYSCNDIITLGCDHSYHHSCIKNMLYCYMDDKCPLCRRIFEYKHKTHGKAKRRLKKRIIKRYSNRCGRFNIIEVLELIKFLFDKDLDHFSFLHEMADFLVGKMYNEPHDVIGIEWCQLYKDKYIYYTDPFCDVNHGSTKCNDVNKYINTDHNYIIIKECNCT